MNIENVHNNSGEEQPEAVTAPEAVESAPEKFDDFYESFYATAPSVDVMEAYLRKIQKPDGTVELAEDDGRTTKVNLSSLLSSIGKVMAGDAGSDVKFIPGKNVRAGIENLMASQQK